MSKKRETVKWHFGHEPSMFLQQNSMRWTTNISLTFSKLLSVHAGWVSVLYFLHVKWLWWSWSYYISTHSVLFWIFNFMREACFQHMYKFTQVESFCIVLSRMLPVTDPLLVASGREWINAAMSVYGWWVAYAVMKKNKYTLKYFDI